MQGDFTLQLQRLAIRWMRWLGLFIQAKPAMSATALSTNFSALM